MIFQSLTSREIRLIILLFILSAVNSLLEGAGIGVFLPLLVGGQQSLAVNIPAPFIPFLKFFAAKPFSEKLRSIALVIAAIATGRVIIFMTIIRLSLKIRQRIVSVLKNRCLEHLLNSSLAYFNKKKISDLQIIFDSYIDKSIGTIIELALTVLTGVFTSCLLLAFLFILSWKITLAGLIAVVGLSVMFSFYSKHIHSVGHLYNKAKEAYNKTLLDILQGMKIIRIFNREKDMLDRFDEKMGGLNNAYYKMGAVTGAVGPFFEFIGVFLIGGVLWLCAYLVPLQEAALMPFVITFLIVLSRLLGPLKTLNHTRGAIVARLAAWQEVKNFLHQNTAQALKQGTKKFIGIQKSVEFRGVVFRYKENDHIVLNDISFVLPKACKLGIAGGSGAGKSTIAELLLRFYDPQQGDILIDGENLKDLDSKSFRKKIGVVGQDTFLFHDTVRANIAFSNTQATFEEIQKAAGQAYAHDFIMRLPQGYDTIVGDRGVLLSGGERQRLAIARAILMDPDILIFDEATSALDSESEKIVLKALRDVSAGKTVITIAHRLSTIVESDKIIVLECGRIIEQGSHEQLIKTQGRYHQLAQLQIL